MPGDCTQREGGARKRPARGTGRILACCLLVGWVCWCAAGCTPARHPGVAADQECLPRLLAEPWPEANRNFRSDPRWLGGDGAGSVDLKDGLVLWLFGDSFVEPMGSGDRHNARIVRNSVAVQTGYDPSTASVAFFWGRDPSGAPDAFFPHAGPEWYWPGSGIYVEGNLVVFLMTVAPADNELGFDAAGWAAARVEDPGGGPLEWNPQPSSVPPARNGIVVGSGSVLEWEGYVYAHGGRSETLDVFLARWELPRFAEGDLSGMEWWAGDAAGWVADAALAAGSGQEPVPVFSNGQMEFSVEYVPALDRWLQVQTMSFLEPLLAARWADRLTGPWSAMQAFYRPEALGRPATLIYAAKSHPECAGADYVFTYAVNVLDGETLLGDKRFYYPEFLKARLEGPGSLRSLAEFRMPEVSDQDRIEGGL